MTSSVQVHDYLMESPDESERLETKTDPVLTDRLLRQVGLAPGMRALDAGGGTGAVARRMSRLVGPSGRVTVLDASGERLRYGARLAERELLDNLSFHEGDLSRAMSSGPYDFVWCRFVFEYLREPELALRSLVESVGIGGKIVVADTDGHAAFHHPCPPDLQSGLDRVFSALEGHFDPFAGRKLYAHFWRCGLTQIRVHVEPYHVYAGRLPDAALANWSQKLRTIAPRCAPAFGGLDAYQDWAQQFLAFLQAPDTFTYSTLIVVEGVRAPD